MADERPSIRIEDTLSQSVEFRRCSSESLGSDLSTRESFMLRPASFGAVIIWVVRTTSTVQDFSSIVKAHTVMDSALGILMFRLKELGEIAVSDLLP